MVRPIWITIWTCWAAALAVIIVFFGVVEAAALARHGIGDTLSETVWYLRDSGSWLYWLILDVVALTALTMMWLLFHFQHQSGRVL